MRETTPTRTAFPARPRAGRNGVPARAALWPAALCTALAEALLEACRYACGSPRSRLHQRAALRELDDRRLIDLGVTRREARIGRRDASGP